MYRVLLVDDEALIREAISENTKWDELGYELVGTCKNGKEAKSFLEQNGVDLVLTDIYMPFCDGIELARFVYENYKDTKVVIISGYDEFEYAKKAVKYQVVEYILKPITARELKETLLKIKEKLDEEGMKTQSIKKIRGDYVRNLPVLKGRFLNGLLEGRISGDVIDEKMVSYGIELFGKRFMTAIVMSDDLTPFLEQAAGNKPDLGYYAIFNIADEIMRHFNAGVTFQDVDERTILIFGGEPGLEKRALMVCEEIKEAVFKFLKIRCTIAVGQSVKNLQQLHLAFGDTKQALEYKFLLGGNQIIYAANLRDRGKQSAIEVSQYTDKIILAIKMSSEEDIEKYVGEFIEAIRSAYISKHRSIFYIQNAILTIMNTFDEAALKETVILQEERELINDIYKYEHLSDAGRALTGFCQRVAGSMFDQKESYCKRQAVLALDYIDRNYGDANMSLNSVCSHLAMSTSYFSAIFKNYTGETFTAALTKKRIKKAKALLENTSKKTYEIADMVGYSDPHYFSSAFKKMTGMTPTEYAKKVR